LITLSPKDIAIFISRSVIILIEMALLLLAFILFLLSDSSGLKILLDKVLTPYAITYEHIDGNIITGIEIQNIRYKKEKIADELKLHVNPLTLLFNKITIQEMSIKALEPNKILKMIEDLSKTPKQESNKEEKSDFKYAFEIQKLSLDANPTVYEGVRFNKLFLELENFTYHDSMFKKELLVFDRASIELHALNYLSLSSKKLELNVRDFSMDKKNSLNVKDIYLNLPTNLSDIKLNHAKINQSHMEIEKAQLTKIDIKPLVKFINSIPKSKDKTQKKSSAILKSVVIKKTSASIIPTIYEPVKLQNIDLAIDKLKFIIEPKLKIDAPNVTLNIKTSFANSMQKGYIKDMKLYTKGIAIPLKTVFDRYKLPLKLEKLNALPLRVELSDESVRCVIEHKANDFLKLKSNFNISFKEATHDFYYDFGDNNFSIKSKVKVLTPYADELEVNNLTYRTKDKRVLYRGQFRAKSFKNLPKNVIENLLIDTKGDYKGDVNKLDIDFTTANLKGTFGIKEYSHGSLKLNTTKAILLSKFIESLPVDFKSATGMVEAKGEFDFEDVSSSTIEAKLTSALIDSNLKMNLKTPYKLNLISTMNANSMIKNIDKNIRHEPFKDFLTTVSINGEYYVINIEAKNLKTSFVYHNPTSTIINGVAFLNQEKINFSGTTKAPLTFSTQVEEINTFLKTASLFYNFSPPNLKGKMGINGKLDIKNTTVLAQLISPKLEFKGDGEPLAFLNLKGEVFLDKSNIEVRSYSFTLNNNPYIKNFFATKSSKLHFKDDVIYIDNGWLNDSANLKGSYHLGKKLGKINIKNSNLKYQDKDFDILSDIDVNIELDGNKTAITGDLTLLGNKITYESVGGAGVQEDSDIIVIQDMMAKSKNPMNDLKLMIKVKSNQPIKYETNSIKASILSDFTIYKEYNKDMQILGMATIKEGSYVVEDRFFSIQNSNLYFTGNPKNPILDIRAFYTKDRYKVRIYITGTPNEPVVHFNSDPFLTQEEALSLILFDTPTVDVGSGHGAYAVVGSALAKNLVKNIAGIKLDHFILSESADETINIEFGQKISDNITIIYLHENAKDGVKARIEHNENFETDIIIMPPNSSSIEFLYKKNR